MELIPADSEEKLGFHLVRQRLDALALTTAGRERLREFGPSSDRAAVQRLLEQTAELQQAMREDDPLPMTGMPDVRDALRRAQPKDAILEGEQLAEILSVLMVLRRTYAYFKRRSDTYPTIAVLALGVEPADELEEHIARIVDARGQVRDNASAELGQIRRRLAHTRGQLDAALLKALREAARQGFAAEEQPTIRNGRAVIPVRAEAKRKVQGFVHDVSGTGQTVYIEPAAVLDLNNQVRELELEQAREIRRLLQQVTGHVRSRRAQLGTGLDVLARLDELQARARLANGLDAIVPDLNDAGTVRIVRGRNPALMLHFMHGDAIADQHGAARSQREVVPLDLELSDSTRTIVITGPNAGGKSVALKTTGLFCLMASCGLPLPCAPGTSLPLFKALFVDIGDQQSIEHDLSTFTSHLVNLRRMLAAADERSLVLIDEAGTGTDPAEGGALAQAVLESLTACGARTVVTTHHGTLKAFAHETPRVENASMEFDLRTLEPTYVFRTGTPGSSYAFEIAKRVGLGEAVLDRSRALVGEQKARLEELIASFDARSQELEARLRDAEDEVRRAEQVRRSFEGRDRALRERRREIVDEALARADRVVAEANARVEQTIREIKEAAAEREQTRDARERLERFRERITEERGREAPPTERSRPEHEAAVPGEIGIGDQVVIDGTGPTGEVLELSGGEAVVALGQMRVRTAVGRLQKVGGRRAQQVHVRAPQQAGAGDLPALRAQRRIDVRGLRVDEAVHEAERLLDQAVAAGVEQVEVLHGKGTGALREAIREYLRSRPEVSAIEDAPWNEGGFGVTVVSL